MTNQPEPIRKSSLPTTPPPEWEFHTVTGARTGTDGCALFPGDAGPVVVRRLVTYGDWEPVRPDRWADEPKQPTAVSVPSAGGHTDRRDKYATAISRWHRDPEQPLYTQGAEAVMAVADAEQAELRAELERLRSSRWDATKVVAGLESRLHATHAVLEGQATTPTDRAALRDRIRLAIARQWLEEMGSDRTADELDDAEFGSFADAVLAVLPEATSRAAVLREAADALDAGMERFFSEWPDEPRNSPYALGQRDAANALRRMADETATETPQPSLRERHRAAWRALTPDQQAARLAELDQDDEPTAGARQDETATETPDVYLTTPCDACNHTLNWHSSGETGCTVPRCACARYYHAAGARQDGAES